MCVNVYIHIHIERERERDVYIYIYVYNTCLTHMYSAQLVAELESAARGSCKLGRVRDEQDGSRLLDCVLDASKTSEGSHTLRYRRRV